MSNAQRPAKAQLVELDAKFNDMPSGQGKSVTVQFNPETLKVSFANQVNQPANTGGKKGGKGDQSDQASQQVPSTGSTKLALQLWFDVSAPLPAGQNSTSDVRDLTKEVVYFITPKAPDGIPPGVSFQWGSFRFDGLVESLEESLVFFSDTGMPLRASISLNMSRQQILQLANKQNNPPGVGAAPGTRPLSQAPAGVSLQSLVDGLGRGGNWQAVASANGIENPRLMQPGQLIDLNFNVSTQSEKG